MDIRQTVFGEAATRIDGQVVDIDLGVLIPRLLFFDAVIVKSTRLGEIPHLIRKFGKAGFLDLLNSGVLKISCEFTAIITDIARNGVRELPLFHFSFGRADLPNRATVLRSALVSLQGVPGLKNTERAAMEEVILERLVRPPSDYGAQIQAQIESDLRTNTPALKAAISEQLNARDVELTLPLEVRVEETRDRVFHAITNLEKNVGMSEQMAHDIVQPSISAVVNLNQRLAEMEAYTAITGFAESEAPILFGKLAGLIGPQNPRPVEEQFARVIEIANLPDFVTGGEIDVDRLLRVRESEECREFRAWLSTLEGVEDDQIKEMVSGIKNQAGSMIRSNLGKTLRFALTTAVGLIPRAGVIAGPIVGAVDSFLMDKLLPTSGVFAFLTRTYPSLFISA